LLGGTKNGNTSDDEVVDNAISQRRLRSDNSEVNALFPGNFSQRFYISRLKSKVMGNLGGAGVTRSNVDFFNFGALG